MSKVSSDISYATLWLRINSNAQKIMQKNQSNEMRIHLIASKKQLRADADGERTIN